MSLRCRDIVACVVLSSAHIVLLGCGTVEKTVFVGEAKSDAESGYRAAVALMEGGSYDESIKAFHALKLKYPYATRWATLCDLRIADAYRYSGDYAQAAVSYQAFSRTYPTHSEIEYAVYRAADCYYRMIPSDLFILPDPWQRDRKSTSQARGALETYLRRYPKGRYVSDAKLQHDEVMRRLANYELYVAEYDFKNGAYSGSVRRLVDLLKDYPKAEVVPKAHILLAHSYIKLGDPVSAKRVLVDLMGHYPESEYSAEAGRWIASNPGVP